MKRTRRDAIGQVLWVAGGAALLGVGFMLMLVGVRLPVDGQAVIDAQRSSMVSAQAGDVMDSGGPVLAARLPSGNRVVVNVPTGVEIGPTVELYRLGGDGDWELGPAPDDLSMHLIAGTLLALMGVAIMSMIVWLAVVESGAAADGPRVRTGRSSDYDYF